jgi:hypothetical protein
MWMYEQLTGRMLRDGVLTWVGYSGHGEGRNNPAMENIPKTGPIPKGEYTFGLPEEAHSHLGPYAIPIHPKPGNSMLGRSGFFLHGDDAEHDASEGCIIKSPKSARKLVWESGDHDLIVV